MYSCVFLLLYPFRLWKISHVRGGGRGVGGWGGGGGGGGGVGLGGGGASTKSQRAASMTTCRVLPGFILLPGRK